MKSRRKGVLPLDLVRLHSSLAREQRLAAEKVSPRLPPSARGTPRQLPPLSRHVSDVTSVPRDVIDVIDDVAAENVSRTAMMVRTPGGAHRAASLFLSRAATRAPLRGQRENQEEEEGDGGEEGEKGEEEDDVPTELPTFQKPDPGGINREFTFTGYDIMADVPSPPPELSPAESRRKRQLDTYHTMCRQMGVIPVSFIEKRLMSKEIRMRSHGLGSNGAKALAVTLVENDDVRYLDLSDNQIGPEGGKAIAQMLTANTSLEEVHIDENDLGFLGASAICLAIREKGDFRKLSLAGNKLRSDDGLYISDMIEHNFYLRELILSHNELEFDGAIAIGTALANNDTLEVLDLSWNHIRGPSAVAVAYGLSKNSGLRVLNVAYNGFGREGCRALGAALGQNSTLKELDIRNNRVYMDDVGALLKGLEANTTLGTIRLGMNPITPHGAMLVLKKLDKLEESGIREVDLTDIVVTSDFLELMKELQEKRVLRIRHGIAIRHSGSPINGDEDMGIYNMDPRALVFKLMERENLRVIDLFHRLDDDNSFSLTRSEFKQGILMVGLPITEDQLDRIVDLMDADGDGTVDLGELLDAERQYKRQKLKMAKKAARAAAQRATANTLDGLEVPGVKRSQARSPYGATDPLTGQSTGRRPGRLKATALSTIASLGSMKVPR